MYLYNKVVERHVYIYACMRARTHTHTHIYIIGILVPFGYADASRNKKCKKKYAWQLDFMVPTTNERSVNIML